MRYRSADHAMACYLGLLQATDGAPGRRLYDDVDRYLSRCWQRKCKAYRRWRPSQRWCWQDGKMLCKECGAPRQIERVQVLHAAGRERDANTEPARDRLADLGRVFMVLRLDDERLLAARVLTPRREALLPRLRECLPFGPWRAWDDRELGENLKRVRREVEERLEWLDLLASGREAAA